MSSTSLMYWQEKLYKGAPRTMTFEYEITGAKAVSPLIQGIPVLSSFDAITQPTIDTFLGTSSEFTTAKFDAVAMGVDAFGIIVDMAGQVQQFLSAYITVYSGANGATVVPEGIKQAGLTDSTLATEAALSSLGNLGFRGIVAGLDALGSGLIKIELNWISK